MGARVSANPIGVLAGTQLGEGYLEDDLTKRTQMRMSVIVPVFNEVLLIRPFLLHLRERAPEAEITAYSAGELPSWTLVDFRTCR